MKINKFLKLIFIEEYAVELKNYSKLYFPCDDCDNDLPHVYYFILPGDE